MEKEQMPTQLKDKAKISQPKFPLIKKLHEQWAIKNGYRNNDRLNSKNTIGFKNGAER